MSTNDNEAIKRRRQSPSGEAAEADDVSRRQNDAVSRLEQRMDLMEASFQREILEVKKAADLELLAKNSAIESQLLSMQDETGPAEGQGPAARRGESPTGDRI